jgi:ABC-type multidrug transport system ATPase subunit
MVVDTAARKPAIEVVDVSRAYRSTTALDRLSLTVGEGEVHALLGRNGAGKTTLVRLLSGLVQPSAGTCRLAGVDVRGAPRRARRLIGLVPSGDRSFYLRLSALENLIFFGRLYGLRKDDARRRGLTVLEEVGLADVARRPLSTYSHGMQKRVSVARALLVEPPVLLVDEATHDLDPEGSVTIRELVRHAADRGAAVLWATQRVEEIRGFADRVTVIEVGRARFSGTVGELVAKAGSRRFVVSLAPNGTGRLPAPAQLTTALGATARITATGAGDDTYLLALAEGATLGTALGALLAADVELLACRHERPEVEQAFLTLVGDSDA